MVTNAPSPPGTITKRKSGPISLLFISLFVLSTATEECKTLKSSLNIQNAMSGYYPLESEVLDQPDRGRKSTIFTAWNQDSVYTEKREDVINSFVDVDQHGRCSPSLTESVITSYEAYKILLSGAISFATDDDATTPLGTTQFSFKDKAGYGASKQNPNAVYIRDFFNQYDGEARFIRAICVTHTVHILPFQEPVFTPAFLSALHLLSQVATDTNAGTRQNVFRQFVNSYGSHFARTTHFGYAAYFGKLFASRSKNSGEETARSRCMLESANEALTPAARRECETTSQHFSRVVVDKCGEEGLNVLVHETGSASASELSVCDLAANESPKPVAYILKKISALFEAKIKNSMALSDYFEEYLGEHIQYLTKKEATPSTNVCLWRRFCAPITATFEVTPEEEVETLPPNMPSSKPDTPPEKLVTHPPNMAITTVDTPEEEVETVLPNMDTTTADTPEEEVESSLIDKGGIIIVGGFQTLRKPSTANSLALFTPALPPFPVTVAGNSLSRVGKVLYSCGGNKNRGLCWSLESTQSRWQSFQIPWELEHHSAVVVNDEIWLFSGSKLRILYTTNLDKKTPDIELGFNFGDGAVAHGSKVFVIGAGSGENEVWVNTDPTNPKEWSLISHLKQGRDDFGAVVFGSDIFVTGGRAVNTGTRLSSAEVINVVDGTVRNIGSLNGVRNNHQMAIIDGRPAVLGGWNGDALATVESYNERTNSWETLVSYTLGEPRSWFGLLQCLS